jgi:hypothetical protein
MTRVDLREEILDDCVFIRVKVDDASVYHVALERVLHSLLVCLVRVAHVGTGPELDIM